MVALVYRVCKNILDLFSENRVPGRNISNVEQNWLWSGCKATFNSLISIDKHSNDYFPCFHSDSQHNRAVQVWGVPHNEGDVLQLQWGNREGLWVHKVLDWSDFCELSRAFSKWFAMFHWLFAWIGTPLWQNRGSHCKQIPPREEDKSQNRFQRGKDCRTTILSDWKPERKLNNCNTFLKSKVCVSWLLLFYFYFLIVLRITVRLGILRIKKRMTEIDTSKIYNEWTRMFKNDIYFFVMFFEK